MLDISISRLFQETGQRIQGVAQRVAPFLSPIDTSLSKDSFTPNTKSQGITQRQAPLFFEPPRSEREKILKLLSLLSTGSPEEKKRAAELLGGITNPPQDILEALKGAVGDSNTSVRQAVIEALNKIGQGPRIAIEVLTTMLESNDENIKKIAQEELNKGTFQA